MTAIRPRLKLVQEGNALERLAAIEPGDRWFVSCYLPLSPAFRARGRYVAELKNRVREATRTLATAPVTEADRAEIQRDLDRIVEAVAERRQIPDAPGLALFACEPLGLLLSVPLPRPGRVRVAVDHVPHLREVRAAESEFGRVAAVLVDRERARLFEVGIWGAMELAGLAPRATRGGRFHPDSGSPGTGEKGYHHRIEREREMHYDAIVQQLVHLDHLHPFRGLVVIGPTRETSGFVRFLDGSLLKRLIGTGRQDIKSATAGTVKSMTFALCADHDRRVEREEVGHLLNSLGEGWGVNGVRETTEALARGQLRTLFVRADTDAAEADAAIEEAVGQRVRVILLHDPEASDRIHQLGGFLRFK